jgi:MFS family permease
MADHFGRKLPIAIGCLIMILGAFLSAFTDGFGSTSITDFQYHLLYSFEQKLTNP